MWKADFFDFECLLRLAAEVAAGRAGAFIAHLLFKFFLRPVKISSVWKSVENINQPTPKHLSMWKH